MYKAWCATALDSGFAPEEGAPRNDGSYRIGGAYWMPPALHS
jgi:hypothetical protein